MSKINILSKDIYNKIAAGEVVEKPASVVKELVENSIDAGATNITIEVLDGGISQIKVSDNGCGIDFDDFDKVFLAHATSKVKTIDDLSGIGTLGFRGEALSSIASVSNITLSSKTETASEGYQVKVSGGEMSEITPIGATTGTFIVIEDLFFNIPARKKFLRKPKLEESDITNYVARLILANPNISFKYIADNKIVYQSFGTGLYDAIYSIYGKSIVDNIFEVNFERGDFKFSGYLGKPTYSKANRTYQTLIINGRYVINQTISTSIYKAYENFLMKGNFPFFVLHLTIPLDKVDVNVHPNKLEVKFEDSNSLFGLVYTEISNILYNINTIKKVSTEDENPIVDKEKLVTIDNEGSQFNATNNEEDDEIKEVPLSAQVEYESNKQDDEVKEFQENMTKAEETKGNNYVPFVSTTKAFEFKIEQPKTNQLGNFDINESSSVTKETLDSQSILPEINSVQPTFFQENTFKIIGTLFNTYILIEKDNNLLLIDQHAGHERLLFDKFNQELLNKELAYQPLIIPFILETNRNESIFINENIDIIKSLGFDIEEFGDDSFKISCVPLLFENINLEMLFAEILKEMDNRLIISQKDILKDYIAKKACKSAVKANNKLTDNEISKLISMLDNKEQVLLCPHGRPIIVEIDQKEVEKWFKRIV
ncbi:MAG: DNA mismatch repair endonuclease MutL [Clostridia bacterium]|nr:DNA mismatch repair endonuclease MutL [Clostridia bacterium]